MAIYKHSSVLPPQYAASKSTTAPERKAPYSAMEKPSVRTTVNDPGSGVTWDVLAYRKLTPAEMAAAIRTHLARRKGPKPKRGSSITIVTLVGYGE